MSLLEQLGRGLQEKGLKKLRFWWVLLFFWTPLPAYQDHIKGYFKYYNHKLFKQMKMKVGHLEVFVYTKAKCLRLIISTMGGSPATKSSYFEIKKEVF